MKILIIRNAFSYDFGGAERMAVHIAAELKQNKINTVMLSRQPRLLAYAQSQGVSTQKGWWWTKQNWSGLSILLVPIYILWQIVLTIWYLQLMTRQGIDAVHILSKDDFIAATIASRLLGKPVVWTDTADLKFIYRNHKVWYKNPVGKLVFVVSGRASHVTLVSHNERRLIEQSLGRAVPANYRVIHIAGKDENVTPVKRSPADRGAVVFCATSRLVIDKGIGELIEAFAKLTQTSDTYRLWLLGDGPDQDRFTKQAANNPHITFFGHVDKPLPQLAAADVYMHPSYHEGFSLSLTEAAMLGKPMIATDVGGNPELVNAQNGLLVPIRNAEALHDAMKQLGSNRALRASMGKQARKDYTEKFDFSHIIKTKFMPLYEKRT